MARRGFNGALMRAFTKDHTATVTEAEHLTPHFVRLRFHSDTLLDDVVLAPAVWLRFWFPGIDDPTTEHQRAYTITEADPENGTFAIDCVLHEPTGPASAWAATAQPGDEIAVMALGPSKFTIPPDPPEGYLMIGDAAALPGIRSVIEALPADIPIEVYLEQHHPCDPEIPFAEHPRMRVHWVPRVDDTSLAAAIEASDWSNWYAWVTPESASLKHLRVRLRDEFGFPKSEMYPQAYWVEGRAMGTSRTEEVDDTAPATPVAASSAPAAAPAESPPPSRWKASAGSRLLAPLKSTFIVAGVLQALVTLLELAPFVLLVELGRRLLTGSGELWALGITAIILLGVGAVLATAMMVWLHQVDARFARQTRQHLLGKLTRLPLGWFTDRSAGQIKKQVQDDTLELHYLVTHAVPDAVAAVVAPIAVLVYLFVIDWRLGLALFIPVLVHIITMYVMVVQSTAQTVQNQRWSEWLATEASVHLDTQPVIRIFGGGARSRLSGKLAEYTAFMNSWQRPFTGKKIVMDLATRPATFLVVILGLGTPLVVGGSLSPVDLLPFLLLGTTFGSRLLGIGYGLGGLRDGMTAARRIQTTLEEPELSADPVPGRGDQPGVEFDRVHFSYRPGVRVLDDVSLRLRPGTVTALVGASGSGKSTLAALVARFHDVDAGAIRVNGRDIRDLTPDELYAAVGFVFQHNQLIAGTVRDNLALAAPHATDDQIEAAARAAQIHHRIVQLPQGYDTFLGRDAALSGGEKQRLAIARTLLADTPILILDEATALADPESEHLVQQAISQLTAGRTVLVIAHRLHTVTGADQIVLLEDGRIADRGTHRELLAQSPRYRQLWDAGAPHRRSEDQMGVSP